MSGHTPIPWHVSRRNDRAVSTPIGGVETSHRFTPHRVCLADSARNAAHIVRCVNAHDELVAALAKAGAA